MLPGRQVVDLFPKFWEMNGKEQKNLEEYEGFSTLPYHHHHHNPPQLPPPHTHIALLKMERIQDYFKG